MESDERPPVKQPLVFERHVVPPPSRKAESGRFLCRWCNEEIHAPDKRLRYCPPPKDCGERAAFASSAPYARWKIEERDKGVCAVCGMDTEYVKSLIGPLLSEACSRANHGDHVFAQIIRRHAAEEIEALGFSASVAWTAVGHAWSGVISTHLWEMDHIVPVVRGGGACGKENLRTLCRACHHRATKKLAGERAKEKRVRAKEERHKARMRAKQMRLL